MCVKMWYKDFIELFFCMCAQTTRLNRKAASVSVTMVTPMEEFDLMLQFWLITPTSDASSVPKCVTKTG